MKTKKKRIKKIWAILLVVVLALVAVLAALYLWQQENIKAAANARRYTQAQLEEQLSDSRGSVQEALDQHPDITVRDLNGEERKALRSGELSPEELVERLIHPDGNEPGGAGTAIVPESPEEKPPVPDAPGQQPTETPDVPQTTPEPDTPQPTETPAAPQPTEAPREPTQQELYEQALSRLVAQVFVMREQYTAQLDAMVEQAKAEYKAMPESSRTRSNLLSWAGGYMSRASEMEAQCDAQMDAILAEMGALIRANNGDTSILKTMAFSYAEEKSIQKSIYIQELEKRGIM